MATVGTSFPGMAVMDRKAIRSVPNPLDKSTIVSIYPKEIKEFKVTIQPGYFEIPSGTLDKPGLLTVGPSSWWKELEEGQPLLEIPNSSIQIADALIKDWCNGLLGYNANEAMPGLFFIPGQLTVDQIKKDYKVQLETADRKQSNWYRMLVKLADSLWARSNGNPLAIGDDMRMAASELQIKDRPWLKDFIAVDLKNCPACGVLRNSNFPVCQSCHTIVDLKAYNALGLKAVV